MPSTAVYLEALPLLIASIAAFLMWSGVSKSGSPTPSPMMSRPAALSPRAMSVPAIVGEGLMRWSDSARKAMAVSDCRDRGRQTPNGRPAVRQGPAAGTAKSISRTGAIYGSAAADAGLPRTLRDQTARRAPGDLVELWRAGARSLGLGTPPHAKHPQDPLSPVPNPTHATLPPT